MSQPEAEVGFYGKLPFKGDFLQRRVPQEFVDPWDAWLQQCLHESRQQLQDAWLDAYLTGPIWRFVFSDGVCGAGVYAGVLVPSVDRVGRYFPLTIVSRLNGNHCPLEVACAAGPWFEAAEAVALAALEAAEMDIDEFDDRIEKLARHLPAAPLDAPVVPVVPVVPVIPVLPGAGAHSPMSEPTWRVPLEAAGSLQRAVNLFAYGQLSRAIEPVAFWWSDGSDSVAPCWLSTRGLPDTRGFAAMLSVKAAQPS